MKDRYDYTIREVCKQLDKSPQAYYKSLKSEASIKEAELRFVVLSYITECRKTNGGIGGVSLWKQYQRDLGKHYPIGRDKFASYIRKYGLYVRVPKKRKAPETTNSRHDLPTYPNLVSDLIPDRPNQVWSSDITYIPIETGDNSSVFSFLSLIMDNYTKEIIGYSVGETLSTEFPYQALLAAFKRLSKDEATHLIHHSDRGVQYASHKYTNALKKKGIQISMTETGDPKENAQSERLNSTMKNELLKGKVFHSIQEVRKAVAIAVDTYNTVRPHMSLDYKTPQEARACSEPLKKRWRSYREEAILRHQQETK